MIDVEVVGFPCYLCLWHAHLSAPDHGHVVDLVNLWSLVTCVRSVDTVDTVDISGKSLYASVWLISLNL